MQAMLGYLEKVTLTPNQIGPEDAALLRAVGLSEQAIQEALYVCFIFNMMDRLADAFDFHIMSESGFHEAGQMLYKRGYSLISIPG